MEPNQIHVLAAAVSRDAQQVIDALEPRFMGEIVGDVADGNRRNRIDDDVAVVHGVATTDLHMRTRPDANGASDSPAPDALAKALGEHHQERQRCGNANAVKALPAGTSTYWRPSSM